MKKRILLLDNYDSFTYNLYHSMNNMNSGYDIEVFRNDKITVETALEYQKIVLSPGPGLPKDAGILMPLIEANKQQNIPMLGVCLGHQGICEAFGAELFNHKEVFHGIGSHIRLTNPHFLFEGIETPIQVGRYHSWSVKKETLSDDFLITSEDEAGTIMSVQHRELHFTGMQFHPESYLCPKGDKILTNWMKQEVC